MYNGRVKMNGWLKKVRTIYWYDQYALNESETAFSKYDPDRIIKELLYTNADIYVIYATNQFNIAYYPSKFIPKHPGLKKHDYVGEIVPGLRKKGKKVVLYTNWLDSKHPEWNIVPLQEDDTIKNTKIDYPLVSWANPSKKEGKVRNLPGGRWQFSCINSPKGDLMKNVIKELVEKYEFDGFHLDMFFQQCVCVCEYCKPFLKEIFGKENIRWVDVRKKWYEYINWRFEVSSNYLKKMNEILMPRHILAMHNAFSPIFHPAITGVSEKWLPHLDVFISECFDVFEAKCADMNTTSVTVKIHRAVRKPSLILLTSTPLSFGHSPVSKAKFLMYASAAKVNGCQIFGPCGIGARQDTTTDKRLLKILKDTFSFYNKGSVEFNNLRSAAKVGVVFSFPTKTYYEPGLNPTRYIAEFMGWCRVLIEKHIPFNIEIAEFLDDVTAGKYDVLILPNTACTDTKFERVIEDFVSKGGKLIASGETSLYDNRGKKKKEFGLSEVLGVSFLRPYEHKYFYVEDSIEPIICGGSAQCVKGKAKTLARLISSDPSGSPCGSIDPLPYKLTDWSLYAKNRYKKGEAYYIAWEPGRFNTEHGCWQTKKWMSGVIDTIIKNYLFTANAPGTVEIMVWEDESKNRLIFKLSNRTIPQAIPTRHTRRDVDEIIPISNIELLLKTKWKKIKVFSAETNVKVAKTGNEVRIVIDKLDAYASVVLERL